MEINPIGQLASASGPDKSSVSLAENFENFLTLLTTQLQNQDPLEPLDSSKFTEQLVQFSSVEQQIKANKRLEELITLQKSTQAVSAVGFLGKTAEMSGDTALLENGQARFTYALGADAAGVQILMRNAQGQIVRSLPGETATGKHNFEWDGLNDQGIALPEGAYKIEVTAVDAEGNPIDVATGTIGVVTGVTTNNGSVVLKFGEISVPLDRLISVSEQTTASSQPN